MPATKKVLPAKITARWLKSKGACADQVRLFAELWPSGVGRVTARDVARADRAGLSILWLRQWLCSNALVFVCVCAPDLSLAETAKLFRDHQKAPRNA